MLLTLGVSSGVVWATTILASPNSRVSIWPPLIIFGIIAAFGAYCTFAPDIQHLPLPGRRHAAITERKQTPAYQAHVKDLQAFATTQHDGLFNGGTYRYNVTINMSRPAAVRFRQHFPEAASRIDGWNVLAGAWDETYTRFRSVIFGEQYRLFPQNGSSQFSGMLQAIATGEIDIGELVWSIGGGQLLAQKEGWSFFGICKEPASVADFERDVNNIWDSVRMIRGNADVQAWNALSRKGPVVIREVLDALEIARLTHEPDRTCDGCPR
jgi:hypothetical protein